MYRVERWVVCYCTVFGIDGTLYHLSLQDGWTTLMMASQAGQVECVKVLLEKGADVNMQDMVSGVIMHCVHAMQHVPRVSSSK